MTDIALIWNWQAGYADLSIVNGDLATDQGLQTSAIISLFTDAQAQPGDAIPDGSADPRGWWGDMPIDPAQQDAATPPDRIGSRLWLLWRALQTAETLQLQQNYANEALHWMLDDGEASTVVATPSFPGLGWSSLSIEIDESPNTTFTLAWQNS